MKHAIIERNENKLDRAAVTSIIAMDPKLSTGTVELYARNAGHFIEWLREHMGVEDVRQVNRAVVSHYKHCITAEYADSTINLKMLAAKTFYDRMVEAGHIEDNPFDCFGYQRVEPFRAEFKAMTVDQVENILLKLRDEEGERSLRNYSIFLVMIMTGVRASELCNARFENIIFEGGLTGLTLDKIRRRKNLNPVGLKIVRGKGGKTRIVEFSREMLNSILDYRRLSRVSGENFFFTIPVNREQERTPFDRFSLNYTIKTLAQRYAGAAAHAHTTRHTFASVALAQGAPVDAISDALGHSSLDMTKRYLHRKPQVLKFIDHIGRRNDSL